MDDWKFQRRTGPNVRLSVRADFYGGKCICARSMMDELTADIGRAIGCNDSDGMRLAMWPFYEGTGDAVRE
eukprot:scaffold65432_cov15-Prasinocladus_malaysianus.AAC.1